jgi:hypothetical protein
MDARVPKMRGSLLEFSLSLWTLVFAGHAGAASPEAVHYAAADKTWIDPVFPGADIRAEYIREVSSPDSHKKLVSFMWSGADRETHRSIYLQGGACAIVDIASNGYSEDIYHGRVKGAAGESCGDAVWTPDSRYCVVDLFSPHGCCTMRLCVLQADGGPAIQFTSGRNFDFHFEVLDNDTVSFLVYKSWDRGELKASTPDDPGRRVYVSIKKLQELADFGVKFDACPDLYLDAEVQRPKPANGEKP